MLPSQWQESYHAEHRQEVPGGKRCGQGVGRLGRCPVLFSGCARIPAGRLAVGLNPFSSPSPWRLPPACALFSAYSLKLRACAARDASAEVIGDASIRDHGRPGQRWSVGLLTRCGTLGRGPFKQRSLRVVAQPL